MCNNFCNLSSSQRILEWRNFRNSLTDKTEIEQLHMTAEFWSNAPLQTYVIDWDQYDKWPSSWELIHEGNFDTNVIAILMEQTLLLSGWEASRLKLHYIKDTKIEDQMMVLIVDNKWVLNYSYRELFDYNQIKGNCLTFAKYQSYENKYQPI